MINLKRNPEAVRDLDAGDIVSVDNQTLVVGLAVYNDNPKDVRHGRLYLTTVDSPGLKTHAIVTEEEYAQHYRHLRRSDPSNKALMAREEMIEVLQSGDYYIG